MDAKNVTYGDTALDRLLQWLRSSGEPKDVEQVVRQYLEILRKLVVEDKD